MREAQGQRAELTPRRVCADQQTRTKLRTGTPTQARPLLSEGRGRGALQLRPAGDAPAAGAARNPRCGHRDEVGTGGANGTLGRAAEGVLGTADERKPAFRLPRPIPGWRGAGRIGCDGGREEASLPPPADHTWMAPGRAG
ncbi:Hypothetical predicted protein [Marmota monax]|uniref:Uncharacterized protein n=1 Tax=Marmota monax TaxID=9995 RepID=A0A5E4D3P0_MARMO|nr:Hypothetical predicted protein [Marmota monax]